MTFASPQEDHRPTVLLVDDHDIVRFGMQMLLTDAGFEVVASSATLGAALPLIEQWQPDLVVTDMGTGDSQGTDTVRRVVEAQGPRPVLVISMQDEILYGQQVIALGAAGYVMKASAHANLIDACRAALQGECWISPRLAAQLMARRSRRHPHSRVDTALTARELQVLELLKQGKSTKEIATALGLSVRTVDSHRATLKQKLALRTGAELIAYASQRA